MKILVVSFYYEPDLSAGSFRVTSFVRELKAHLTNSDIIEVITTLPNRYRSFTKQTKEFESDGILKIRRFTLPPHKNSLFDQSFAFSIYFMKTLNYLRNRKYDIVFATSSRLFTAFLGAIVARQKHIPLYIDIRDIFVDTMKSVFGKSKLRYLIPLFHFLEKFTVCSASRVNLVSRGFKAYFERKYKKTQYSFFPNGVDDEFLKFEPAGSNQISLDKRLIFTYTGNIGEGQGLEKIVPQIAERYRNIQFRIIGDGARKDNLREQASDLGNVFLLDPVERKELIRYYDESDVLFLHLNNYDAFRKVLPSKIFEYAATYKPIVAGVDGYAKEFLETYLPESLIFKPSDFDDFCNKFIHFRGEVDPEKRKDFIAKFSRHSIMSEMVKDFLSISY